MQNTPSNAPDVQRFISSLNRQTEHNIHLYSDQPVEAINKHIQELDKEWSIERMIEAGASVLALTGIVLGAFVSPLFLILPTIIIVFYLAHAFSPFSSALTVMQGKGMRTACEINAEKFAMKALRGDVPTADSDKAAVAERTIAATRAYSSAD